MLKIKQDGEEHPEVVDVTPARSRRGWRRILAIVAGLFVAAAVWPIYVEYIKPRWDQTRLDAAFAALIATDPYFREYSKKLRAKPSEQMLLAIYRNLQSSDLKIDDRIRLAGARAALDLAITGGSFEARLKLGKAYRDGLFGRKDNMAALREFERVRSEIEAGVRVGDGGSLWALGLMQFEGLGVERNQKAAIESLVRAGSILTDWRLQELTDRSASNYYFFESLASSEQMDDLLDRAIKYGGADKYIYGSSKCADRMKTDDVRALYGKLEGMHRLTTDEQIRLDRYNAATYECRRNWYQKGAVAGNKDAMAEYGLALAQDLGDAVDAKKWLEAAGPSRGAEADFFYGLVLALNAENRSDAQTAIRQMHTALKRAGKRNGPDRHPGIGLDGIDLSLLIFNSEKLLKNPDIKEPDGKFAMVLLALARLQGTNETTTQGVLRSGSKELVSAVQDRWVLKIAKEIADDLYNPPQSALVAKAPAPAAPPAAASLPPAVATARGDDPERRKTSGYLPGTLRSASGGLSTFTVDNANEGEDAIARLYRDGKKPAVRSFYVKHGEKFTANTMASGKYILRYRMIGSEDTFEANRTFLLAETEVPGGRHYSNVTVTLYKVNDGNLETRKVAKDDF